MTLIGLFILYLLLGALVVTTPRVAVIVICLVIVPVLFVCFGSVVVSPDIAAHLAIGTSLAIIVFTSISSIRTNHQHLAVRWELFRPLTVGIVGGAVVGAWTASLLSGPALQTIIGAFAILVALKMILEVNPKPGRDVPGTAGLGVAGGFIGWASAIFGIGGGTISVPYLTWCNVKMQQAVGTSAAL